MALTSGLAHTELVDEGRMMTGPWQIHFREQVTALDKVPSKEIIVQLPPQTAAIGFGALPVTLLTAGLYRVSMSVRITAPASTSSKLGPIKLLWTDKTVTCEQVVIPELVGNAVTTVASSVTTIRVDYNTPIAYSVVYESIAPGMTYELRIVLEGLGGE